jgi:hypothetical protein
MIYEKTKPEVVATEKLEFSSYGREWIRKNPESYADFKKGVIQAIETLENNETNQIKKIGSESGFGEIYMMTDIPGFVIKKSQIWGTVSYPNTDSKTKQILYSLNNNSTKFAPISDIAAPKILQNFIDKSFGKRTGMVIEVLPIYSTFVTKNKVYSIMPELPEHVLFSDIESKLLEAKNSGDASTIFFYTEVIKHVNLFFVELQSRAAKAGLTIHDFRTGNIAIEIPNQLPEFTSWREVLPFIHIIIFDIGVS